ncbi:MAG: rhodanese-like domain-containing protein [Planctomycetes bacterium]|nr:rhodanese-like domain-containing protein [Planctomycetota bacterium]
MIQQLPPQQCFDLLECDAEILHLDVRTPEEFSEGHALGAINVPAFFRGAGGMQPNPEFVPAVVALSPDTVQRIVLSCRSGGRSNMAAEWLEQQGYQNLINMPGGFHGMPDGSAPGWLQCGLPTSDDVSGRDWETQRAKLG